MAKPNGSRKYKKKKKQTCQEWRWKRRKKFFIEVCCAKVKGKGMGFRWLKEGKKKKNNNFSE